MIKEKNAKYIIGVSILAGAGSIIGASNALTKKFYINSLPLIERPAELTQLEGLEKSIEDLTSLQDDIRDFQPPSNTRDTFLELIGTNIEKEVTRKNDFVVTHRDKMDTYFNQKKEKGEKINHQENTYWLYCSGILLSLFAGMVSSWHIPRRNDKFYPMD